ncbi:MAG TPA: TetR/AcrR family transcriptional regulator [Blastocatellia bacterium]|jgi:AcrR family transcriptional regulator|nr:TetR/AcrR family transcriptional regulator [Blastocatellia bacterium]
MRTNGRKPSARRKPKQRRSQQTVEAVLDAVVKILKRGGVDAVTTNRIAEVAGVSIGSVYQYFLDKRAIFLALHDRHVEEIGRLVERTLTKHAASSLEDVLRALVEAVVDAHAPDPKLYELLHTEAPHRGDGARRLAERLSGALRLVISSGMGELKTPHDLERVLFVVTHMVDALSHGAVLQRPPQMSLAEAKEEAVRAILAYLRA